MNLELLFVIRLSEAYCYDSFRTVTVASAQSTAKVCCATKDSFMLASIALLSTITAYTSSLFQCLRVTSHYGNLVDFTGYLFTNYVCRLRVTIFLAPLGPASLDMFDPFKQLFGYHAKFGSSPLDDISVHMGYSLKIWLLEPVDHKTISF